MVGSGQAAATLTVRRGPGAGRRFDIGAPAITIGRSEQCDFPVNDTWMSRQHARIIWSGTEYLVEDLGSTNGTYVNGERIQWPRALKSGDLLQLGEQVELAFQVDVPTPLAEMPAFPDVAPPPRSEPGPPPAPAPAETTKEEAAKTANGALIGAIVGLVICGIILEPHAIMQARKAKKTLRPGDPGYGKAQAAEIIAWIGLALWILGIIVRLSNM
jgi:hypothetical protein